MTVTTKEQVPVFPDLSVDVHVTVVSATISKSAEPESGEHITVGETSTLSVAVGVVYVSVAIEPMQKSTGQSITGGSLSA